MSFSTDLFLTVFAAMVGLGWFLGVPADIALPSSVAAALAQTS